MQTTSEKGIELIKQFEGLRLKAYQCSAGVWTIGYGHTKGVKQGQTITEQEAERLLKEDLRVFENCLNSVGLVLSQNQFDALVSFIFNVGAGNFRSSTLLKKAKINQNDLSICSEFAKWKFANKKELPGLVGRRAAEADLYFSK